MIEYTEYNEKIIQDIHTVAEELERLGLFAKVGKFKNITYLEVSRNEHFLDSRTVVVQEPDYLSISMVVPSQTDLISITYTALPYLMGLVAARPELNWQLREFNRTVTMEAYTNE